MASNHGQGQALRAWQLALRSNRKQPDFFQVGGKPVEAKTEEGPSAEKEMKQKRGRPPRRGGSAGQPVPVAVSSQVSPSCSPVSSPTKQGGKKSKPELMVIEEGDDIPVEHEPLFGRVVWAQFGSFRSYHPALVIKGSMVNLATPDSTQSFVFWFSDRKVSAVPREKLLDFVPFFKERAVHCHGKQGQQGILKAIEELQRQAESGGHSLMDMDPLHWAQMGFPTRDNADFRMFRPGPDFHFPESILERLADIGAEIREKASLKDRDIPNEFHDESAITAVWQGTKNISDVCIGCGDWDRKILCPHPLFKGGLCCKCKDSLQETFYAIGDDGTHSFCAVCGAGGQLFVCDTPSCGRVFCVPCVEELGGEDVLKKVQDARTWPCFLCQPFHSSSHGLLTPHPDWRENLVLFFDMGHRTTVVPDLDYFKTRRPIRVLSLFDGIGTGLLALKRAGFQVEVYYASETDGQATIICQANHSQAVTQLGDVTKITTDVLAEIAPIDLLMGGSPCNELSLANPLRKGFDVEGSGVLFFDFYRVLRDLQALNGSTHLFWLYENVASMRCAYRAVISRFLQCQPAVWDAKHLSAQKRSRFFWGNIPGLYSTPEVSEALRQEVDLNSVLTRQCGRQANVQRVRTVTTQSNSLLQGPQHSTLPVTMAGGLHTLWLSELERLFGFPTHYTDVGNLPPTKRRALLGRSWSVQVITEILRPLSQYFATASNDDSHMGSTSTREANSDTVVTDSTATHIETFVTSNCDTSESDWTATHVAASLTNNSDTSETDQTATAITETDQTATAITETDQTATAITETDQTATAITETDQTATAITETDQTATAITETDQTATAITETDQTATAITETDQTATAITETDQTATAITETDQTATAITETDQTATAITETDQTATAITETDQTATAITETDQTATAITETDQTATAITETDQTATAITETDQTATAITETDQTATAITETDQTATAITETDQTASAITETDQTATAITETDQTATAITETDQTATAITETDQTATAITETDQTATAITETDQTATAITETDQTATAVTTSAANHSDTNSDNISTRVATSMSRDSDNADSGVATGAMATTTPPDVHMVPGERITTVSAVPAVSTVSYSGTTNTASVFSCSDTTKTSLAVSTVSYSGTTNTASAISYSDTTNTVPAVSTVSYSDTTNTVSIVSFSDTTNVSTVSYSDTTNTIPAVSYSDTKNTISTVSYSDTTNTIPAISYSSTRSDAGKLNSARADKPTGSSTRSDKSELNSALVDKPTRRSTRSDKSELNSALADKPTRRSTRTSAVKGRCALTDDVEHSSVPTDRADRNSPVAGPLTRNCTRIDTVERSAPVAGKTPKHSFTLTGTVKRGSTRCVTLNKRRSGRSGISEHSTPITSRVRCSSSHTDASKSSSRATAVKSSSPATAVETSSRATAVKSNPDAGAVRCSAHASAVTSRSDTNAVKSDSDINAVRSSSDVNAVKSRSDSNAVKSRPDSNAVKSRSDAKAVKSRSDAKAVKSRSDANAVKSSSDANAVKSRSDANAVKSSCDANAVESSSDANAVKSRSDANAVKSGSDTNAVKSSPDACTGKCRSRADAARFSSSRAITGRTRRRAADTSKTRRGAADMGRTRRGAADMGRTRHRASDRSRTRRGAADMEKTGCRRADTGRPRHRTGAWSVAGGSETVPENDNKADPVQVVSLSDSIIVTPDPGRDVAWKASATGSDDLDINPAGASPSAGGDTAAHSGTVFEPTRLLTGNPPDRQNSEPVSTIIDEPPTTTDSQTGEVRAVGCSANTMGDVTADSSTLFAFISATGHSNSGHSPVSGVRESEVVPTGVRSDECRGLSGRAAADPASAVRAENVHQPALFPVGIEGSIPGEASGLCPSEDLEKGFDDFQLADIDLDLEPGFDNEKEVHDEYPDTYKCVERFVGSIAHLPDNDELPSSNDDAVSAADQNSRVASNPMHEEEVSALEEIISADSTAEDDQSDLPTSDIEEKPLCSSDDDDHFVAVGILTRALRPRPSSSPPTSVTAVEALTPHETTTTTTTTVDSERHGPAQDVLEAQGDGTASGEGRTSVTGSRVSDQGDASQRHHNPTHDSKRETLISVNKTATGSDDTTEDCLATSASAAEHPSLDAEALPTSNRSPRKPGLATKQSSSTCPSDGATNTNPCMRLELRDRYLVLQKYSESKRAGASSILGSILEEGAGTSGSVSHQLDQPDASAGACLSAQKEGGNSGRLEGRQGRCTLSLGDGVTLTVELHDDRQDTQRSGGEVKDAGLCPNGAPGGAGNPQATEVGRETAGESCVTGPGVSTVPDCVRTKARICYEPCQTYPASVQMCPRTRGWTEATTEETATTRPGQRSVEEDVETRVTRAMSRGRADKPQSKRRESCIHSADSRSSCGPSVQRSGRPQTTTAVRPKSCTVEMAKSRFTPPGAVSEATYDVEPRRSRGVHMPRDPPICGVATDAEDANESLTVAVDQISMARKVSNVVTGDVSSACAMALAADDASSSGISATRSVKVCSVSSSMNASQKVTTIDKTKKAQTSRKGPFQPENVNRSACRTTTRSWCDGRLRHRSSGTEKAKGKAATLPTVDQRERNQQPLDEEPSLRITSNETAASVSSSLYITPRQEHREKLRLSGDNANGLASVGGGVCCSHGSAHHQSTAGVPSQDQSTAGVPSQDQSTAGVPSQDQSTAGVPSQHQSTAGVPSQDQSTAGVPSQHQSTAGVPSQDQSTAGVPSQHQSTAGVPSQDQSTAGVPSQHQSTAGVPSQHQSTAGVPSQDQSTAGVPSQDPGCKSQSMAENDDFRKRISKTRKTSNANRHSGGHRSGRKRSSSWNVRTPRDRNDPDISRSSSDADQKTSLDNASSQDQNRRLRKRTRLQGPSINVCSTADEGRMDSCQVKAASPVNEAWQRGASTSISSTADGNWIDSCSVKANSLMTQTVQRRASTSIFNTADGHGIDRCEVEANCPVARTWQPRSSTSISSTADKNRTDGCQVRATSPGTQSWHRQKSAREGDHAVQWQEREMRPTQTTPPEDHRQKRCPRKVAPRECPPPGERRLQRKRKAVGGRVPGNQKVRLRAGHSTYTGSGDRSSSQ